jgi:polysaccharide export outer membrane protein
MVKLNRAFATARAQFARCSGARLVTGVLLTCLLSACMLSPGLRMSKPAVLPSGDGESGPAAEVKIPITEINVALIKQLHDAASQRSMAEAATLFSTASAYTLGPGDVLQITVWDHPELAQAQGQASPINTARPSDPGPGFVIDQEGNLQFPYIDALHVAGLRVDEVQRVLVRKLKAVLRDPQVTVRMGSYRAKQVYVEGEVRTPGAQPINDIPMTVYEAVNRAGGFIPTADQARMLLIRDGQSYPINLTQLVRRGMNPANIVLKNGDLLRVVSRDENGVYVMGEVNKPATALPMRTGVLTLSDAISQAGSFNSGSADPSQLYVIRDSMGTEPRVFHLNASSPVSMILANQFELQPRDVVYIDGSGLVRLSRVLGLLLPAINAGLTGAVLCRAGC